MSGVVWNWQNALRAALCAAPAVAIIASGQVSSGLAWAIGALPAAVIGLQPTKRQRRQTVAVGVIFATSMLLGSLLAGNAVVAVVGMFLLAFWAAQLAAKEPIGLVITNLCLPLAAIGLSFGASIDKVVGIGSLIILSCIWSYVLSLLWPEYKATAQPKPPVLLQPGEAKQYGLLLGLTAATAATIGFALELDHVGWVAGAALFVMRPVHDLQQLRSVGRVVSVFIGALAAALLLQLEPSAGVVAVLILLVLAGAGATRGSRWYVTPAFSTFIVLMLLLYGHPTNEAIESRFVERVGETMLGVAIAYFIGLVVPKYFSEGDHS